MDDHSKYYITGAFVLGATLAVLYKSRKFDEESHESSDRLLKQQQKLISRFSKINDLETLKKCLTEIDKSLARGGGNIKDGIEGCIGDTPLIKIKSLSEVTGCEILAKAEVLKAPKM
jgi:cysteine synthase A